MKQIEIVLHPSASKLVAYSPPGIKASYSFNQKMFIDDVTPPERLTITGTGFRSPPDPVAEATAHVARLRERAAKAEERAATATAIAERYEKRATNA